MIENINSLPVDINTKIHVHYVRKEGRTKLKRKIGFIFNGTNFHNCTFPVSFGQLSKAITEKKNFLVSMYDCSIYKEVFLIYQPDFNRYRFVCVDNNNVYFNLGIISYNDFVDELSTY